MRTLLFVLVAALATTACRSARPFVFPAPWYDHPIRADQATKVRPGMTAGEVIRTVGRPYAGGPVARVEHEHFGAEAYSVHCDPFGRPAWSDTTWIYLIDPMPPRASEGCKMWYLFVAMKGSVAARVFEGCVVIWSADGDSRGGAPRPRV